MARPSLAEKMYQSLSKGPHVDAALRIASRLQSESEKTVEPAPVVANVFPISSPSQSNNRASNQSSSQASNRAIEQTIEQSSSHSDGCSDCQTVLQSDCQTVLQSDYQTVLQSDCQTVLQSDYQTVLQSDCQTVPTDVLTMSNNQSEVLKFLINAQGKTTARAISLATNLGIPSVRDILRRLKTKGFLCGIITVKDISFQGFLYTLNPVMIDYFISTRNYQTVLQSGYQTVLQSDYQTVLLSDGLIAHSSSLKTLETTTTKDYQTVLQSDSQTIRPSDSFVLTGPTGLFWEGEGLQESQAKKWCQQFEVEPQQMRQQLEWARFDLVGNGKSGEVRKDAISWFFGCLRQTGGCYPRPANYKSPAEIRAEQAEQAARDAREARERLRQAEQELAFDKLLSAPESEAYQQLLVRASDFAKEMGGATLERELRTLYFE